MLSEVSPTEKNTYCMTSLTCGMQKLKQTSEYNKQKKSKLIENKLVVTSRKSKGERSNKEVVD